MLEKTKELINSDMQKSYSEFYDFINQPRPRKVPYEFVKYTKSKGDFMGCFLLSIGIISFIAILAFNLGIFDSKTREQRIMENIMVQQGFKKENKENNKIPPQIYFILAIGVLSTASMIYSRYKGLNFFRQGTIYTGKLTKSELCNTRYDSYYEIIISVNEMPEKKFMPTLDPKLLKNYATTNSIFCIIKVKKFLFH